MLHIYIVSLEQDIEKRKVISKTLENLNLGFSFINAVYGKNLSEGTVNLIRDKSAGKLLTRQFPLTPGEIGCTLSHLKVYQNILDNNLDWACVLEDDVILDKRFKTFISDFKATGLNPGSLYILGRQNGLAEGQIIKSLKNIKIIGGQKFTKTIKSEAAIYGTFSYLMSAPLAEKIINDSQIHFILADDWSHLVKQDIIKKIYLSDFVNHPLDLSVSCLQKERGLALANLNKEKTPFSSRVIHALKWRIRALPLKAYRYVEKKDVI